MGTAESSSPNVRMTEEVPIDLHDEVEMLRAWLANNRWVDQYDRWWLDDGVVGALQRFLAQVPLDDWSDANVTDLLYILEESSTDYIAELIAQSEPIALAIAKQALSRGSIAGADLAERLGQCVQRREEAEVLLMEFSKVDHERTRRMALLSLANFGSAAVPELAVTAWNTGDEYQRMGALSALKTVRSELYPTYLSQALSDGRENLKGLACRYASESGEGPSDLMTDGSSRVSV